MTPRDLSTIVDLVAEPCLIVGTDARIHAANRPAVQLLGWSAGQPNSLHEVAASAAALRGTLGAWATTTGPLPKLLQLRVGEEIQAFRATGTPLLLSTAPACIALRLESTTPSALADRDQLVRRLALEIAQRQHVEERLNAQLELLERIASGGDLDENLTAIANFVQAESDVVSSVLLFDDEGKLRHRAAPTLPAAFVAAMEEADVMAALEAVGGAATGHSLIVSANIAAEPAWHGVGELAFAHDLLACWAMRVRSPDGDVVGLVLNFSAAVGEPSDEDRQLIQVAAHLASLATARHRSEEQLRSRALELEALDKRKNEFLAMLGHELRTPLASVVATVELFREARDAEPSPKKRKRWLSVLSRQLRLLGRLVDGLIDVARVTRGAITLSRSRLDLRIVVEAVTLPESRDPRLSLKLPSEPVWVLGDHDRLQQVVDNLVHNACKYTPSDGHIELLLDLHAEQARLCVRDDGAGIAADELPFVFELFSQGPRSIDRSMGGLGIGLTLVKSLVESHGGSAFARSEGLGRGCEFEVQLPLWAE